MPTMQRCKEIAENYERQATDAEEQAKELDKRGDYESADALRYGADMMRKRAENWRQYSGLKCAMQWSL